jgi:hypothetical protein
MKVAGETGFTGSLTLGAVIKSQKTEGSEAILIVALILHGNRYSARCLKRIFITEPRIGMGVTRLPMRVARRAPGLKSLKRSA